ncbi:hypothetical protein P8452_70778 [Trifolium repens]|nr:hypothetical protein P8452_70778 [Trifolium repens]
MASSSSSRNVIPFAVDDKKPVIIDDSEFVSEPNITSVESNIWGEELIIPHKLEGVSKTKDANTSTDSTTPAATSKKSLPNTGAKLRKRTLMASKETGEPTKQKKQKALTIQEPPWRRPKRHRKGQSCPHARENKLKFTRPWCSG